MPTLTIKGLLDALYRRLKQQTEAHGGCITRAWNRPGRRRVAAARIIVRWA